MNNSVHQIRGNIKSCLQLSLASVQIPQLAGPPSVGILLGSLAPARWHAVADTAVPFTLGSLGLETGSESSGNAGSAATMRTESRLAE